VSFESWQNLRKSSILEHEHNLSTPTTSSELSDRRLSSQSSYFRDLRLPHFQATKDLKQQQQQNQSSNQLSKTQTTITSPQQPTTHTYTNECKEEIVQSLQKQGSVLEELRKQFCNTTEHNTTAAKQEQQRHYVNGNHAIRALHQQQQNQQTNKQTKKLEESQSAQDVIISNHEIKKAP